MKISDEIRRWCKAGYDIDELRALADRIDSEMVELPKDKDGEPIHVGDKVYLDDGRMACVTEIDIMRECEAIECWDGSKHVACHPSVIVHERPDSWERIADDIEESKGTVFISETTLDGWAYRIRRMAEKEDER